MEFGGRETMKIGLIDVIDWQTTVDFRDGRPIELTHPMIDLAGGLLAAHRYPGDLTPGASGWVTDVALDLARQYRPDYMFLDYANINLATTFSPPGSGAREAIIGEVFGEIARFVDASGFVPVIIGLGEMLPFMGYIDVTGLECQVVAGGMSPRYAGLNAPSRRDLDTVSRWPEVTRIVSRADFRSQFGGSEAFYTRFPDYIMAAADGYTFKGVGSGSRPQYYVPRSDAQIPLHTPLQGACDIVSVSDMVLRALSAGQKVVLILVEGVGCESFPLPHRPIDNTHYWYHYAVGEGQYLALGTGRHFVEQPYPPGYCYYVDDHEHKPYPFSGIYSEMPAYTIGERFAGKSAAVGSRGMITHIAAGAEITIECFVRALYNHGVMAILDV
jgi:hypothetical protein